MNKLMLFVLLSVFAPADNLFAAGYAIDPAHSSVGFSISHMVIANVKGVFNDFTASFKVDDNQALLSAEADVKVESISTRIEKRDNHLRSADFFDAAKYPKMTFVSTGVKPGAGGSFIMTGRLTIKGITRDVTLAGKLVGPVKDPWGGVRMGFSAEGKINRRDFGLTWNQVLETGGVLVGEDVTVELEGEGVLVK